jgi:hypothetical protein
MSNQTLRLFRLTHLYFGLFITPALLFFAITGALQTFSLHEQVAGSSYKPSPLIAKLAQIHKNQTTEMRRPQQNQHSAGVADNQHAHGESGSRPGNANQPGPAQNAPAPFTGPTKRQQHVPLKIFFVLVSLGLLLSSLTGIYMAYKYQRSRITVTAVLVLGMVTPLILLKF